MADLKTKPFGKINGTLRLPGDKSISHRALIFGALAQGKSRIRNLSDGTDVLGTSKILRQLGVRISDDNGSLEIEGRAKAGLGAPRDDLDCGNSGTSARLLMGMLASCNFDSRLIGDPSLSGRPMGRVAGPLREMGASIELTRSDFLPATMRGGSLVGIDYETGASSAQVKSAILIAGLQAEGKTRVTEAAQSRDHTENMLGSLGIKVERSGLSVTVSPGVPNPFELDVPADPSSAAFFVVGAILKENSKLLVRNVLLNPTRTGFIEVLTRMGAEFRVQITEKQLGEDIGEIEISSSTLRCTDIAANEIPGVLDELPVLAVAAAFAEGTSAVRGASELRNKESDRIKSICEMVRGLGATVVEHQDGYEITGTSGNLRASSSPIQSYFDHRIAMAAAVAAIAGGLGLEINGWDCTETSFPGFLNAFESIGIQT